MKQYTKIITLFLSFIGVIGIIKAQESINLVGKLSYSGLPIHDVWGYTDTTTGNQYALLCASTSGMRIINVSDPSNPFQVGTISGGGVQPIDVKTWKNYAYTVAEDISTTGKIIDLSDPTIPVQVGTFPGGHNIWISDSGYLYLSAPGLRIFDLNPNPVSPVLVYTDNTCSGHDAIISDNRLYDFSDNCGTNIYDISSPTMPVLLGTVIAPSIFHHSGWPSINKNYVFICDELASPTKNDITVWDISNPTSPFIVDSFADPSSYIHNLYVIDNYAYVSYYRAGFRLFDISDPTSIKMVAEYDTDSASTGPGYGGNFGLYIFWGNNKILASDEKKGLYIFNVTGLNTSIINQKDKIDSFLIFPNPASESISIETQENLSSIEIHNATGQTMKKTRITGSDKINISINELSPGIYFLKIQDVFGNIQIKKIIINK